MPPAYLADIKQLNLAAVKRERSEENYRLKNNVKFH